MNAPRRTVMILVELDTAEGVSEERVERLVRAHADRVSHQKLGPGVRVGRADARVLALSPGQLATAFEAIANHIAPPPPERSDE